jgi:ABC-type transport system involved in multi-copper enzyme maturation permease subunit
MLTAMRLTYRINRFEIRAILLATALSVVVSAIVLAWMRNSGYNQCIQSEGPFNATCFEMQDLGSWMSRIASMSQNLAGAFPLLAGLLLGAPLIARELDRGTARLAWSLGPSRPRWYVQRVIPILVVVALTAMTIGIVSEQLVSLFAPGVDLAKSFVGFHTRGVLLATSALVIASAAIAVGAVVGRQIPTLLLALILGGVSLLAIAEVDSKMLAGETVRLTGENQYTNDLVVGEGRFELPDGRLMTWEELAAYDPRIMELGPEYPYVQFGIPRERYREIETREAVAQVVLCVLFLGAGAFVVSRRRPG